MYNIFNMIRDTLPISPYFAEQSTVSENSNRTECGTRATTKTTEV